jgi:tetratricopeptide (TPR) repeat protein
MKKIAVAVTLLMAISIGYAQEGNNICVWNALKTRDEGGGTEDLEKATKCSDEAIANDATSAKSKTWFYRGQLYRTIFQDSVLRNKYGTSAFEAIKAFKKLSDLNDPKFKDWDDAITNLYVLGTLTFNEGVENYQKKNYAQAYQYFYAIKDINATLEARKKEPTIKLETALKNAAISAENAGDRPAALNVYKEWLAIAPSTTAYDKYANALKKSGDTAQAIKIVDEGLAKFPKDANLLVEKINTFLDGGKYTDALVFVNNLLDIEPKNEGALFIKGLAYDKLNKEDSVVYYYNKTIEVNPKYTNAYINLAAVYVNKAKAINIEMNKLGNSAADVKKYDEMGGQIKALYVLARPYLQKAADLDPSDAQVNRTLKQIDAFMDSHK